MYPWSPPPPPLEAKCLDMQCTTDCTENLQHFFPSITKKGLSVGLYGSGVLKCTLPSASSMERPGTTLKNMTMQHLGSPLPPPPTARPESTKLAVRREGGKLTYYLAQCARCAEGAP